MTESQPRFEIRDLRTEDLAPIGAAVRELPLLARYGVTEEGLRRDLAAAMARGEGLLCASRDGTPVGFAWFLCSGTFAASGYLRLIAVGPGNQGASLGSRLMDEVERRVGAVSRTMFLLVSGFNVEAQRFYQRRGYADAGVLSAFVRPDVDERIYWKRLR
jgi:ribosomal protein S18 acetylase RimI-like enzyme